MRRSPATLSIQEDETDNLARKYSFWKLGLYYISRRHFSEKAVCLVIICVALCFNLYHLGLPSMWFDEVLSYERARQSLSVVWKIDFTTEPNMALYYLVLHFWLRLTGMFGILPTEFVMRLPSALFATLSSVMLYLLARCFLNRIAALISVSLYILNVLQLMYAQETRSYSMELLLLCLTTYLLITGLEHMEYRELRYDWLRWCLYGISCVCMVYTHLFSAFIITAHFSVMSILFFLPTYWRERVRKSTLPFLLSQLGAFIVLIPLLLVARKGGRTGWLPTPDVSDMKAFFAALAGGSERFLFTLLLVVVVGAISLFYSPFCFQKVSALFTKASLFSTLAFGQRHAKTIIVRGEGRVINNRSTLVRVIMWKNAQPTTFQTILPITIVLLCLAFVPFFGSYIISQGPTRLFSTRYLVAIVPPLLLLVGLAIAVIQWRAVQLLLSIVLLVFASLAVPYYYNNAQVENWKQAAFWLEQHYQTNDGITCYDNAEGCELCISYYLQVYPKRITFPEDAPGSFPWVNYDLTNQITADTDAAINITSLQNYVITHERLFFIIGRLSSDGQVKHVQATQNWLNIHYIFIDQITTTAVSIRLYRTNGYH